MDWGSLAGQLADLGASSSTVNVALEAGRQAEARGGMPYVPNTDLLLQQQNVLLAVLQKHRRRVDISKLDLSGLWINAQGFWMEVVRAPNGFTFTGKNLFNEEIETGNLTKQGRAVIVTASNILLGRTYSAQFTVVNEDFLAVMRNQIPVAILRRISKGPGKPYAAG